MPEMDKVIYAIAVRDIRFCDPLVLLPDEGDLPRVDTTRDEYEYRVDGIALHSAQKGEVVSVVPAKFRDMGRTFLPTAEGMIDAYWQYRAKAMPIINTTGEIPPFLNPTGKHEYGDSIDWDEGDSLWFAWVYETSAGWLAQVGYVDERTPASFTTQDLQSFQYFETAEKALEQAHIFLDELKTSALHQWEREG